MLLKRFRELISFCIVGITNTLLSLIIYYCCIYIGTSYFLGTVCGYIGSSIVGYFLNKIWVFQAKRESTTKSMVRYYIVYGSALLINLACMHLWVEILGISETLAPLLTLCITIPYNFILSKFWVFKKTEKEG